MSIKKCDKIMEKSSISNWIFFVILLSQQSSYIRAEPESEPIPLVRLPSNTLLKYTAYKDVSILHFVVPSDTRTALFNFKAYEETKSAFRKYPTSPRSPFALICIRLESCNPINKMSKSLMSHFICFFPSFEILFSHSQSVSVNREM